MRCTLSCQHRCIFFTKRLNSIRFDLNGVRNNHIVFIIIGCNSTTAILFLVRSVLLAHVRCISAQIPQVNRSSHTTLRYFISPKSQTSLLSFSIRVSFQKINLGGCLHTESPHSQSLHRIENITKTHSTQIQQHHTHAPTSVDRSTVRAVDVPSVFR